ncbi:50S ribosomal protein L21 [Wenxinia saemankumensis]|uniref:Large ribosomal subunit protein bL21 n=1 Tax=Wenxinia saemankumensis TaxID=1447782 RepID=A0A1M6HJH9_9RHOB|nr:50S ribosomal protein L21 [Wenxinia saemankumensis]SHJ22314.1 LSU ribosomal protein L21P [Wenxinia saemankumensis]
MFAVLKTGGKQYKVASGDVLRVEKIAADPGEKIQFNDILMMGSTLGLPLVADAAVQAEVIDHIKGEKVIHFVKRRRKHGSKRTKGHRQQLTLVRITDFLETGAGKSDVKAAIGAGIAGYKGVASDRGDYAQNRERQAEMTRRVAEGDAAEKSAAPAKAPKAEKADQTVDPAASSDDLKKLSGVGPAIEKKLHAAGVTSYAQIAAWTEADIAQMDEQLNFKGRIEREGWVEQAKDLAKG